ncbi:hypothetical protein TWF694_009815 [Orbilia ellipsospora]|uniref:Fibroin-3 related protein n=1 Tax=Orbilia ellipsospora TaxID=2528407 RepID=A0AAV9XD54_9PEZI
MAVLEIQPMAVSLGRRSIQDDLSAIKSWDGCMSKAWCKYPVIAGCVVGGLVLISMAWCCYRCCCRRRRKAARSKSTFFSDPVPAYMSNGQPSGGYAPHGPQFAYFESGTTAGKNADDLPVMPSWNNAKSEKVEDTTVKVEDIELGEVDHDHGRKQQSSPPPQKPKPVFNSPSSPPRLPLGGDRYRGNNNFGPSNNLNPFGPQRMNSPFGNPNNRIVPPSRTQSPYPESNIMPSATIPPPSQGLDFDFSPHINAHNQGPYANADVYTPEPTYQQNVAPQFSGVVTPQPNFTRKTSPPPAAYQQPSYTGTTVAEGYAPPQLQQPAHNLPTSNTGFVAQMDDDFGHSPVHLTDPHLNNGPVGPQQNHFNHNEFDHGGYNNYNTNNQTAPAPGYQGQNAGYERPQQGWPTF